MYLLLSQQKFSPGTGSCHAAQIVYYGDILYLSEDLSHFIYQGKRYNIKFRRMSQEFDSIDTNAISARRGKINADIKKYYYDTNSSQPLPLIIIQTKDVNTYLHNVYEFTYVTFAGMRFEMIIPGAANF